MKKEEKKVVAISETEPRIKRVDLLDGGREGLKVTYDSMEVRGGVVSALETSRKQLRPVQKELRFLFKELQHHLLRMCGYHWSNDHVQEMLMDGVSVNYIISDEKNGKFQLGGTKRIFDKYKIALNSPNTLYEDYSIEQVTELKEIFRKIIAESKAFISGAKGADTRQVAIDYMITKKDMSNAEVDFDNMSEEEQKAFIEEAFENYGLSITEEDGKKVVGVAEEKGKVVEMKAEGKELKKAQKPTVPKDSEYATQENEPQPNFGESEEEEILHVDVTEEEEVEEVKEEASEDEDDNAMAEFFNKTPKGKK